MYHTDKWYDDLSIRMGHRGFVTMAEILRAEREEREEKK